MRQAVIIGIVAAFMSFSATGMASAAGVVIVHHKVANYAKWRPFFDADKANQLAAGLTNPRVYRSPKNPNDLTIIFDMADMTKARAFAKSPKMKDTMAKAGVLGSPTIKYLNAT